MSPSKYWASALPALPAALSSVDRLVELQRPQRRARRLQRILGLDRASAERAAADRLDARSTVRRIAASAIRRRGRIMRCRTWFRLRCRSICRKSFGRMPPALTITASLRSLSSLSGLLQHHFLRPNLADLRIEQHLELAVGARLHRRAGGCAAWRAGTLHRGTRARPRCRRVRRCWPPLRARCRRRRPRSPVWPRYCSGSISR